MGRIFDIFAHAFAMSPTLEDAAELPDTLKRFAQKVVDIGMETPAILFLETTHPLSFLVGQTLLAFNPMASPIIDDPLLRDAGMALENKHTAKKLVEYIEALSGKQ